MKNWIIAVLVGLLTLSTVVVVAAQPGKTANVEVRVWQDVNDSSAIYISARPEGGSWGTLGTIPLPLDDGVSNSGRFHYGDITVSVPLAQSGVSAPTPKPQSDLRNASSSPLWITLSDGRWGLDVEALSNKGIGEFDLDVEFDPDVMVSVDGGRTGEEYCNGETIVAFRLYENGETTVAFRLYEMGCASWD